MKWKSVILVLGLAAGLLVPTTSHAVRYDLLAELCLEEPRVIVDFELPRVPVGCEVVDCCPGCPGPWPLDWLVQLDPGVEHVDLTFEQTGPETLERVRIEGEAEWISENVLRVFPGETVLTGLAADPKGGVPVVRAEYGPPSRGELAGLDLARAGFKTPAGARLQVQQLHEGIEVNRFDSQIRAGRCGESASPVPGSIEDVVRLTGHVGTEESVFLIDGARPGASGIVCVNDEAYQVVESTTVGNLLPPGSCNADLTVFSRGNAVIHSAETSWTAGSDVVGRFQTAWRVPAVVQVWVDVSVSQARAHTDLSIANYLFDRNRSGILLYPDIEAWPPTVLLPNLPEACTPAGLEHIRSIAYEPGILNVYYTTQPVTAHNCMADRNVIFVGTTADLVALTHAIGHSYSLSNRAPSSRDIMSHVGGVLRDHFYLGESFRMSIDRDSTLNSNGQRGDITHDCHPHLGDDHCPPSDFD